MRGFVLKACPVLSILLLTGLTGCATTGDRLIMIGTEADFIAKAGLAEQVEVNWLTANVYKKDSPAEFSSKTKEIVWFMVFRNGAFIGNADFIAKWYSPDGALYKQQSFSQVPGSWAIAVTDLPVAGERASELAGKWRIEILYKDQIIAYRSFKVYKS